jgi:hypothetical protein
LEVRRNSKRSEALPVQAVDVAAPAREDGDYLGLVPSNGREDRRLVLAVLRVRVSAGVEKKGDCGNVAFLDSEMERGFQMNAKRTKCFVFT